MFPFSISGKVECRLSAEAAAAQVIEALQAARARDIRRDGEVITFRAGIFRAASSGNALVSVGSGAIILPGSSHEIGYRFSCVELLVLAAAVFAGIELIRPAPEPFPMKSLGPLLAWAFVYSANFAFTTVRLRAFVKAAVREGAR